MNVFHVRWVIAASFRLRDVDNARDPVPSQQCGVVGSFAVAEIKVVGDSAQARQPLRSSAMHGRGSYLSIEAVLRK